MTTITRMQLAAILALTLALSSTAVRGQQSPRRAPANYSVDDWMTMTSVGSFVYSPDGQTIYFTSDAGDSGTDEIFKSAATGGAPTQISTNPKGERANPKANIDLSADGKSIFYTQ